MDTAGLLRLDVRELVRMGGLTPGAVATLTWSSGDGEPLGTISVFMNRDRPRLTLHYQTRRDGEKEWTQRDVPVWLDATPCAYGGERSWFRCPACHGRRAVLYSVGGVFACRQCHDLAYASTRENEADRLDRRIRRVADRLGSDGNGRRGFLWTMPDKPKGMHWRTYERLCDELWKAHDRKDDHFAEAGAHHRARGSLPAPAGNRS